MALTPAWTFAGGYALMGLTFPAPAFSLAPPSTMSNEFCLGSFLRSRAERARPKAGVWVGAPSTATM
jgi:hypothetical protein